jgi:hypothetical protein
MGKSTKRKQEAAAQKVLPYVAALQSKSADRKVKDKSANLEKTREWFSSFRGLYVDFECRDPDDFNVLSFNEMHLRRSIVRFAYVKYNVPDFLLNYFVANASGTLGCKEVVSWFLIVTSGRSFQKTYKNVFSKKEAHLFLHAPEHRDPLENVVWARCKARGLQPHLRNVICKHREAGRAYRSDKWQRFIEFLVRHQERKIDSTKLKDMLDYVSAQREDYSFKGRTWTALLRVSKRWHTHSQWTSYAEPYVEWNCSGVPFDWSYKDDENFIDCAFIELLNSKELLDESIEQHHCVVTYKDACASGGRRIFSMTIHKKKVLTIEIVGSSIVQVRGKYNRRPMQDEKVFISKWAKNFNLRITASC